MTDSPQHFTFSAADHYAAQRRRLAEWDRACARRDLLKLTTYHGPVDAILAWWSK